MAEKITEMNQQSPKKPCMVFNATEVSCLILASVNALGVNKNNYNFRIFIL